MKEQNESMQDTIQTEEETPVVENENKKVIVKRKSIFRLGVSVWGQSLISFLICAILFTTFITVENTAVILLVQFVQIAIVFFMAYSPLWYEGDRDSNLVNFKRIEYDPYRGLKAGLVAAIPAACVYLIFVVSRILGSAGNSIGQILYSVYLILSIPFVGIMRVLNPSSYVVDSQAWHLVIMALVPLVYVGGCVVGYLLGYKRISLMEKVTFKKKDTKKKS